MIITEVYNFMDETFLLGILGGLTVANITLDITNKSRNGQISTALLISIFLLSIALSSNSIFDSYSDEIVSLASSISIIIFFITLDKVITQQTQTETLFYNKCIICIAVLIGVLVFFILPLNLSFYLAFFCIFCSLICETSYGLDNVSKDGEHRFYHVRMLVVVIITLLLFLYFIKLLLTSEDTVLESNSFLMACLFQQFVILLMNSIEFEHNTDKLIEVDKTTQNDVFHNTKQFSLFMHEARNQLSIFNLTLSSLLRQPLSETVEKKVYNLFTAYHEISILIDHYLFQYELASNTFKNEIVAINIDNLVETLKQLFPRLNIAEKSLQPKIFIADKQTTSRLLRLCIQSIMLFFGKKANVTLDILVLDKNTSFQFKITDSTSLSDEWLAIWNDEKENEQQERQELLLAYIRTILAIVRKHHFNIYVFTDSRGDNNLMLSIFHQSDREI